VKWNKREGGGLDGIWKAKSDGYIDGVAVFKGTISRDIF
jgi:hypothetical protein